MRWRVLLAMTLGASVPALSGAPRGGPLRWWADGRLSPDADSLLAAVGAVSSEGLDPARYLDSGLISRLDSARGGGVATPAAQAELDSALTALFVRVAHDLADGPVTPSEVDTMWRAAPHALDPMAALDTALASHGIRAALRGFAPPQPGYRALRAVLATLTRAADSGGWPEVPRGRTLQLGMWGPRVAAVRRRLLAEGDLAPGDTAPAAAFDSVLWAALRRFQRRHGVRPLGEVDSATGALLAVPVAVLVRRVIVNMTRWRWTPRAEPARRAVVNTPDATLTVYDTAGPPLSVRVVAGALDWPTPIFTARITGLVLHPTWDVPAAIVRAEMLPAERRDPAALARLGIGVWRETALGLEAVDPDSVDWSALGDSAATRFRFRQPPGDGNPLGRIKFVVPNAFSVALHDTPSRQLFAEDQRYFSHGCVRVQAPAMVAARIVAGWNDWTGDSLRAALADTAQREITLPAPVPIYFVYRTIWVDDAGRLQWRPDVYGWDAELAAALPRH
jgi:L,D-transpeptidase YcbB